jgi:hypothetical protein
MTDTLYIKNVIFKNYDIDFLRIKGLDKINRLSDNNENYATLTGTKEQINQYLQDKPILSERLRTLNNLPKFRLIGTKKQRIN